MGRSSNGMSMSGAGFLGPYWVRHSYNDNSWRKRFLYGDVRTKKWPVKKYSPRSKNYRVKRLVGRTIIWPYAYVEADYYYKSVGTFSLKEVFNKINSGEIKYDCFIQQEDDVGWESVYYFKQCKAIAYKRYINTLSKLQSSKTGKKPRKVPSMQKRKISKPKLKLRRRINNKKKR